MGKYKILAVDDDFASRLLVKKVLERDQFEVTVCDSGEEALEKIKSVKFDLIISDIVMKGISGLELLKKIKQSDSELTVMLLTGNASIETAIDAMRLGAIDYLLKPINVEELQVRVKKAFERIDLESRLKSAERDLTYSATIATANHEINQPLTVIISATDMVKMELDKLNIKNHRLNNYLDLMNKSSQRIANLLRKLREINSPRIQEIPLGMKMIDIKDEEEFAIPHDRYILVIEDEENLRQIIQRMLESSDYKVILAETAYEGLELYRIDKQLIELVILDFNLPDADGLEVLENLQKLNPEVKVLLTSGFAVDESISKALNKGALDFIRKPFNRQEILDEVRKVYSYNPKEQQNNNHV